MDQQSGTAGDGGDADLALLAGEVLPPGSASAPPRQRSAERLLAAWHGDGYEGVHRLDGVFACVLRRHGQALAHRDPSGLSTLFVGDQATASAWEAASDLAAFHRPAANRESIDRRSLHEYLRLLDIAAPNTIVRGTRAVEPGQWIRLSDGATVATGTAPARGALPSAATFEDAVDRLQDLISASTARCLDEVGAAAAFLSGGVDSALLCAVAARQRPEITTLTVGFDGAPFDESPVAARIAAHLGLRHEVLRFGRQDFLAAFDRLARGMDQPMADPATMVTVLAFDRCRERFDVVLDGTGADEAVGAMPPRHVRLAVGLGSLVPAWLRRRLVRGMRRVPALAGYTPVLDFEHPAETLMRWKGFTRTEIEELCGEPVSLEDTTFYRTFARFPRQAHYARYSALLNAMPCDRLTQALKLTGLRVRFPFCARDVDAFLRQLPTEWRALRGQPKRILRTLLARYVPPEIWDAPKHGFDFPLHDFLAGDSHALVQRHALEGRWLDRGFLRPDVVRRYARQYMAGDRHLMFRVWALVVLGAWLDAHEDLT